METQQLTILNTVIHLQPLHTTFFWIFLAFYLTHEIVHLGLDLLNLRHTKNQTERPEIFKNAISDAKFIKTKEYNIEKLKFGITSHLGQIPFFWILIFFNGFNTFDYYAAMHGGHGTIWHSILFCVYLSLYLFVVRLPFRLYGTFVIEEKYGFNNMTLGLFIVDLFKSTLLSALFGFPLLFVVFWFMNASGDQWWLWVWALLTGFQLIMVAVFPRFIAPLFNKFEPLQDEDLSDQIKNLAAKIKFKVSGVFVMDGSKRSGHSNAYFAGLGRFRRIVLFDTLIKQLTSSELLAVLAHEMGHNVKNHIRNFMILSSLMSLIGFYVLSLLIDWAEFYTAFNISEKSNHAALVIFMLCSDVFTFMLTPLLNLLSRHNEYEADAFSVTVTKDKDAMTSSLIKLTEENLGNLDPHPWYSFYHHSHPTTVERANAIKKLDITL